MTQIAQQAPEPKQGARRYPRTFGGLIGSMVVAVLAIVAYWVLQNATHQHPDVRPESVAYLETVGEAQQGGYTLVYPPSLPTGWKATSIHLTPGDSPIWGLGFLTARGDYVGVQQQESSLGDLLDTYVDKAARRGADTRIASPIASTWSSWSDSGGDHAFATTFKVSGRTQMLLVYGSAPVADLTAVAESLTTAPRESGAQPSS